VVAAAGDEVTVHFEGVGLKRLSLKYADLRPA
jgi:DNA helicase II / ATP-dependent DNA helicase PcrA